MKGGILAVIVVVSMVVQGGEAAVSCGEVDVALLPCIDYLRGRGGDTPTEACCKGVEKVKGLAQTTLDKRAACSCVKAAANRYADLKDSAAQSLPTKCHVELDIPVSRTVDCDKIK